MAECAREPASRVTATSKFPPRAISLQEMLTAAGEANARPRPFTAHGASDKTEPCQKRRFGKDCFPLPVSPASLDGMRRRHETRARPTRSGFLDATAKF